MPSVASSGANVCEDPGAPELSTLSDGDRLSAGLGAAVLDADDALVLARLDELGS